VVDLPGTKSGPQPGIFAGPPKLPLVPGEATTRDQRPKGVLAGR